MPHQFAPGDDLIFQLESGLGLLRILAIEGEGRETVWHLLAYEEFFPSVEAAEAALTEPGSLHVRNAHMALTDRAFERTPAARLGNRRIQDGVVFESPHPRSDGRRCDTHARRDRGN